MSELLSSVESSKTQPRILFVDTQPQQRIKALGLPPYQAWIAEVTGLPLQNLPTVHVSEGEDLPTTVEGIDGIIAGGSGHSVLEPRPWMKKTADFLQKAQQQGIPQVLACFSHQLIAREYGATVARQPEKRFGVKEVRLTPEGLDDPIFDGFPQKFAVFTSNSDVVIEKPTSQAITAHELGRSSDPNEVLLYKRREPTSAPVHTTQYHPELTAAIMHALSGQYNTFSSGGKSVGADLAEIYARDTEIRENGRKFFGNWLKYYVTS